MKINKIISAIALTMVLGGCNKFIDIVPDNVSNMDMIFNLRATAERYLYTCYSYIPNQASIYSVTSGGGGANPAFLAGNEFTFSPGYLKSFTNMRIAFGELSASNTIGDYWGNERLFVAIRDCNNFLENIHKVPDLKEAERKRWIAEVTFLKAYYHFVLFRQYGPIPIIDQNAPLSASTEETLVDRKPIDEVVNYIVAKLDEANENLPDRITNTVEELGRITKSISLSLKAKVLVTAASPLFNGNSDYINFKSPKGVQYFDQTYSQEKWVRAAEATKAAVEFLEAQNYNLYKINVASLPNPNISEDTKIELNIRGAVTERWNSEVVWGNPNAVNDNYETSRFFPKVDPNGASTEGSMAPTLNVALDFYTKNGVPIDEDKNWDYAKRFDLRVANSQDDFYIANGYTTAYLHFDREPRFYATLGFDGGRWYGQNNLDDSNKWTVKGKRNQLSFYPDVNNFSLTGYYAKKMVHYLTSSTSSGVKARTFPWPVIRLADIYLLHAEANNEAYGPNETSYLYINKIRERAGLQDIITSYKEYSTVPQKPLNKVGLREIIQLERKIELSLEGSRFWDQLRWKTAIEELNVPILGWDHSQETTEGFYRVISYITRSFGVRDYFWPIPQKYVLQNPNLGQNFGW